MCMKGKYETKSGFRSDELSVFTYESLLSLWAVVGSAKMDNNAILDKTTHGQVFST